MKHRKREIEEIEKRRAEDKKEHKMKVLSQRQMRWLPEDSMEIEEGINVICEDAKVEEKTEKD